MNLKEFDISTGIHNYILRKDPWRTDNDSKQNKNTNLEKDRKRQIWRLTVKETSELHKNQPAKLIYN